MPAGTSSNFGPGRLAPIRNVIPSSGCTRITIRVGMPRWRRPPILSSGASRSLIKTSVARRRSALPVRTKIGTPSQRQFSMDTRAAAYVSRLDSGATPGSSRYPSYCPRTAVVGSSGDIARKAARFARRT